MLRTFDEIFNISRGTKASPRYINQLVYYWEKDEKEKDEKEIVTENADENESGNSRAP